MTILFPRTKQRLWDRIQAEIRTQVAAEIEAAAPVPVEGCDPRWCHCQSRRDQALVDAATARRMGAAG